MLAGHTDCLVVVSEEMKEQLLALRIGHPHQYRVIPVGIDLSGHANVKGPSGKLRRSLGLNESVPLAGMVGRLVAIKDHVTALRAIQQIPELHLAIIGDGDLRLDLEDTVKVMGLSTRVHFTGWWQDVPSAMADLNIVLLTSRNEGTPVSLIEALACGRPVIATDVGGVKSVVKDGINGRLCPAGNPDRVAASLRSVLADPSSAACMAEASRPEVIEHFGQERLIADVRRLYQEILGQ